ncbi:MAG: DUF5808 domain-containing protein [Marinilabiliales bacterium]|nr:DUF5808 domain-containing protein [Marinilabiliales bacterium]
MKKKKSYAMREDQVDFTGGIYSNPNDSRMFVPKSIPGLGWTLNFGNPKAVRLFKTLFVLIIIGLMSVCLFEAYHSGK